MVSDIVIVALIAAIPATVAAFNSARVRKEALEIKDKASNIQSNIKQVEIKIDGRLSELLELTRKSSYDAGLNKRQDLQDGVLVAKKLISDEAKKGELI